ncbi:non-ribosomal peptide synthetase [Mycolicibacterium litorale]|uniref:Non-ribosomal peptide synthetase n=1 Tax=Mycolicibacterium litorale TaxID=758802 RepID=A0AAD1IGT6_9MYCO|nr:non-ribosomal peptide synthetase [Mycolicibacterium litorale]MCV7414578.1 amino acid adenylation domain-containing protein [Mycolicibacterium litorale]TDY03421.1 mycobactin peptide synthetase MbtE [Mycolicibacterium litorale]BBY15219.1 non-ribosomal peptide synthetase [Mycolicibacterium litorale]
MTDTTGPRLDADARLELLRRRLAERGLSSQTAAESPTRELSEGQLRMWFVQAADPSGALLNICLSYRIRGDVDLAALRGALDAVARRHPILRTTYTADDTGEPRPTVHADLRPGWAEHDLTALASQSEQAQRLRLEVLAQREFAAPFDLSTDAPLRITMVRTGAREHVMLLVAHHIAWDDGSWEVFFADLTRAYAGEDLGEELTAHVPAGPRDAAADLDYWRTVMADPPEPLELPGPTGSAVPTNWRSARTSVALGVDTVRRVTDLARETGCTPYAVLLAAFGALIHRYTHTDDFLVATPVLNRGAGTQNRIGYYGNTVAMRLRPQSSMSFRDMLGHARDTALGAFAHQGVNLDRVVRELNPDRRHGTERMTRVSFGFRGPDRFGFTPPGVQCERADLRSHLTQLPLGVMVEFDADPTGGGAVVEVEHLVEIIEPALARQLLDHFVVLLDSALEAPHTALSRLQLMGAADTAWLHEVARGERFDTPPRTLPDVIAAQVDRTPDAVAVAYEGRHYSYREINAAANRVAHWLIGQGIGAEDRVAVLLDKSPELIVTALGVVKAGAVYVPVDPTYPEDRLTFILGDCDAKVVLREPLGALDDQRDDDPTDADRVRPLRPENTAYLIYTSGTTGLPKGVPVPHRPVAEYFVWFKDDYQVDGNDRLLQVASPSFDVSIAEIFGMLACGARIVVHRPGGLNDIGYLTELLREEGITAMHFVPSLLGLFLSLPGVNQWRTLQRVPIGGEPLPGEVADKFHATFDALLHNFYGPTETVINASRYKVEGKQGTRIVPIGRPKINTQMHLLDDALQPVPVGAIGEIYIGGSHVAHGYHRRPGLTAERFVADPFTPGGRLYRSGDLARRNADGDIEFVGRADEQVKIRGFRIELGDVAAAISVDPSVGRAVVVVSDLPGLGKSLVGYLTPVSGEDRDSVAVDRIRARVAAALPEYMVPAAYVVIDDIPITTHGKIDRTALPQPELTSTTEFREPATDTERELARLFGELLDRGGDIGADDSFFDLGGHSLLATKLVAAVRTTFGVDIGVQEVFELATVAQIAGHIDTLRAGDGGPARPRLVPLHLDGPAPLSSAQLRSWFAYRVDGPSVVNNIPFAARLSGPCDVDALMAAVGDVINRHEILRTVYREIDGVPYQVVLAPEPVTVRRARGDGEEWLRAELDRERGHVFDLERDRPIRPALLSVPGGHVLSVVMHHIAGDHWSATVLFSDLLTAYRARTSGAAPAWAPLPLQYADFGAWQSALLADDAGIAGPQRDYWTEQLAGLPEETGLRPDFPRPPVPSGLAEAVEFHIDGATRDKLAVLCRELGVTEFMLLQAAVAVVLHKAGGGPDVPLGTPVAGRNEPELDQLVGFFINILVLRNDLRGNPTLREVCRRAREMALAAYANQDLPFDQVVDAVSPVRTLARNPLFSVVVHVREQLPENRVIDHGPDGDTTVTVLEPTFDAAHADLSLNFFAYENGGGYRGHVIYRPELYTRETAQRFVGWLGRVVTAFAEQPDLTVGEIEIGAPGEQRRILEEWGGGGVFVLDQALRPVPVGVVGDVYTAGGPLAAAHWNSAALTATRLVAHPYGTQPGARLHRTGDQARWSADGVLELVGSDTARAERGSEPAVHTAGQSGEPPTTDTERALATLLGEVLDVEVTGRYDDFFSLGGDSILAVQLAARARDAGLKLTARMVFEQPTLHDLAAAVDTAGAATGTAGDADTAHAPMSASGLSPDELAALTASWSASREDAP